MDLYSLIGNFKQLGVFDILLPFLLFYAIFIGLLGKATFLTGTDNKQNKNLVTIISIVLSFFVVAYTPFGLSLGTYLTLLFGGSSTILVGLLAVILIAGMLGLNFSDLWTGGKDGKEVDANKKLVAFLIILAIAVIIWLAAGPGVSGAVASDTIWTIALLAVIIGVVFYASDSK